VLRYATATLTVTAVIKLQMDQVAPAPTLTTVGEMMEINDIISGKLQKPQGTPEAECSRIRLAFGKPQSPICTWSHQGNGVPNSFPIKQLKPD